MRVYSDDSIKDCSTHYNGYVLLVQVSVIDKIFTMVANSSGSSVFILQSRGLSPSIPQHVPHCHHLVACVPTLGLSYLSRSRYIPLQRTFGLNCRNGLICTLYTQTFTWTSAHPSSKNNFEAQLPGIL